MHAPVTISHLHKLHAYLDREFITQDANMLKAATLIAFFGLLRALEYLSDAPHSSHHDSPLLTSDIRISTDHSHMKVSIRNPRQTLSDMAVQSQYGQHPLLSVQSKPWKGSFPDTVIPRALSSDFQMGHCYQDGDSQGIFRLLYQA